MRKILFLLVLFACSSKEKNEVSTSPSVVEESKVKQAVYEGIIVTELGEGPIELSLEEAETGMSARFSLKEEFNTARIFTFGWAIGEYTVLQGASNNEVILELHCTFHTTVQANKNKMPSKPEKREITFFLMSEGGNKLVLVDEDFNRISDDNRYTLYKRAKLFTAEGYVTFEPTRTDFFEQNTGERWTMAPLGNYQKVKDNYDFMATEKFEGVYLKALAYTIESDTSDQELFVVKRILQMNKSKAYENDDLIH